MVNMLAKNIIHVSKHDMNNTIHDECIGITTEKYTRLVYKYSMKAQGRMFKLDCALNETQYNFKNVPVKGLYNKIKG